MSVGDDVVGDEHAHWRSAEGEGLVGFTSGGEGAREAVNLSRDRGFEGHGHRVARRGGPDRVGGRLVLK
jgi:hypothetical protein